MFKRGNYLKILKKIKWGLFLTSALAVSSAQAQFMDTSVRDRIYAAASAGNIWELKRLESLGYSLEMTDANGNTPYCQAVWSQNKRAVAALIEAGVDVRPRCLRRIPYVTESRIYAAAHSEDLNQLVAWKKEGLNVDVVDPRTGNSALCEAVYNYDCPAIQTLLRAGSQQAQPCMRRIPVAVREKLQCRPIKIDWSIVGYSVLGAGMAGALVAVLGSGGSSGHPTCTATQRWVGDRCMSCDTCWMGTTCISQDQMNDTENGGLRPYYRDEKTGECWQVSAPPVKMNSEELGQQVSAISTWRDKADEDGPYKRGGYLPMINAAYAYARGYTGYMVQRTSPYGRLVNDAVSAGQQPVVTDKKVTVAVSSSGMAIGSGGTMQEVNVSSGSTSTSNVTTKKSVWDWKGVNRAFYDASGLKTGEVEYTPTGASNGTTSTSSYVGEVGKVKNNFALNDSGTPYGYNFDYGPCPVNEDGTFARTKNCYGSQKVTVSSTDYVLAVFFDGNGKVNYLTKDPTTTIINGTTTKAIGTPGGPANNQYVLYSDLQDKFFAALEYTGGYVLSQDDPTPHYTGSKNQDSTGTFLAGIIAAMKQNAGKTYGVAYDAAILPINQDIVYGVSTDAAQKMTGGAQIILLDEGYTSKYVAASGSGTDIVPAHVDRDALSVFTGDASTGYTARAITSLFGTDKSSAYKTLADSHSVIVVPNGTAQENETEYRFMQPALQSAIPLMDGFNNIQSASTKWKPGDSLPTLIEANPFYHSFLTVGSVVTSQGADKTIYNLASYSQPCGIAGNYCVVAPGGGLGAEALHSTAKLNDDKVYRYIDSYGTSPAAAVVSGALAVLMGAYPHLTPEQSVEILLRTAHYIDLGDTSLSPTEKEQYTDYYGSNNYKSYDSKLGHYYNAIFGYGLIDLDAATDPIGGKEGLWVYKSDENNPSIGGSVGVVTASTTSIVSPASLMGISSSLSSSLPSSFVAFDMYNRPFLYPTSELFHFQTRRKAKTWNDFKAFMSGREPVTVQPTDDFSMTYRDQTNRVSSSSPIPLGLMQATLKQGKMKYSLFYSQDTTLGTEAYWKRRQTNPFIQMRDAYGLSTDYQFNPKWSIEVGWTAGKNGFFDQDDRRFDAPDNRMQAFSSSVVFKPVDGLSLKVGSGVMKENGSSLGMVSSGAFNIKGADTQFVSAGVEFSPVEHVNFEAMYYYGQTKTDSNGGLMNLSRLTSDSFAFTASYKPTEDHLFGLQVSSPLRVRKGALNVTLPVGRHPTEEIYYYETYNANMKPKARELDLSMYYQGRMSEEVSVQGELGVRLKPDHQADAAPDYRGIVGVKWNY